MNSSAWVAYTVKLELDDNGQSRCSWHALALAGTCRDGEIDRDIDP